MENHENTVQTPKGDIGSSTNNKKKLIVGIAVASVLIATGGAEFIKYKKAEAINTYLKKSIASKHMEQKVSYGSIHTSVFSNKFTIDNVGLDVDSNPTKIAHLTVDSDIDVIDIPRNKDKVKLPSYISIDAKGVELKLGDLKDFEKEVVRQLPGYHPTGQNTPAVKVADKIYNTTKNGIAKTDISLTFKLSKDAKDSKTQTLMQHVSINMNKIGSTDFELVTQVPNISDKNGYININNPQKDLAKLTQNEQEVKYKSVNLKLHDGLGLMDTYMAAVQKQYGQANTEKLKKNLHQGINQLRKYQAQIKPAGQLADALDNLLNGAKSLNIYLKAKNEPIKLFEPMLVFYAAQFGNRKALIQFFNKLDIAIKAN